MNYKMNMSEEKNKLIKKLHEDTKLILNGSWENWLKERGPIKEKLDELTRDETTMMLYVIKEKINRLE